MDNETEAILLSTNPDNEEKKCGGCGEWSHECICEEDKAA